MSTVWRFRRGLLLMLSPDSRAKSYPLTGRSSTYRPVQIPETGSAYMANRRTYGINTLSSDSKIFQHWLDNNYTCLTAARTSDGSLMIAYMPSIRRITVDMSKLTAISTARGTIRQMGNIQT